MKAIRIHEHGNPNVLKYEDIPEPKCPPGKIKVSIKASSINHLDLWVRSGIPGFKTPLPMILGSDASGIIVDIGANLNNYKIGDEVIIQPGIFCKSCKYCNDNKENYCDNYAVLGETCNGVQSEYVIVNPINIYPKPSNISFIEAASMPLTFMTSYEMVVKRAKLKSNETILIYGGSSGVGSAAIQIAKDIGANIIATAGNEVKEEFCYKMGANIVLNHNSNNYFNEIKKITKSCSIDVIFEHIGKNTWQNSLRLLGKGGRIVTCGATSGKKVEIDLTHLFIKQQSILGSTMSCINSFNEVLLKINNNVYNPVISKVFEAINVADSHRYIEDRKQMGKVVLTFK